MWFTLGEYLEPTPLLHEFRILTHLAKHPATSQAELARVVGLAPAMVNTYLRRFTESGMVSRVPIDGRGLEYHLTLEGERRRSFHTISCLAEIFGLFETLDTTLKARLMEICGEDPARLVLYGAGETGGTTYVALQGLSHLQLVGVIDDDPAKQNTSFFDHVIQPRAALARLRPELVLITAWYEAAAIAQRLGQLAEAEGFRVATISF
jgi:hypothetical protein